MPGSVRDVRSGISRRGALGLIAGFGSASLVFGAPTIVCAQEKKLKISVYGGNFKDTFDAEIFPEFTKATGIAIESVSQPSGEAWLIQLQQAQKAGQPLVDVTMLESSTIIQGMETNLWAPLDLRRMPNSDKVKTGLNQKNNAGNTISIAATSWYITLVSNTKVFPAAPTSWRELWDPRHKDQLGLLAHVSSSRLLEITSRTFFGSTDFLDTDEGILKTLAKVAELKPNVRLWYRDEAQFDEALKSGEVPMGQYYHDVTGLAAKSGFPVRSTIPVEGGVLDHGNWAMVQAAAKVIDLGEIYIDYMCQPSIQAILARKLGSAPIVDRGLLDLTDDEFANVSSDIPPILAKNELHVKRKVWLNQIWTEMQQS